MPDALTPAVAPAPAAADPAARDCDISIIIVNRDAAGLLRDCLASIRRHAGTLRVQSIVIDNGSADDSVAMAGREFPEVLVLPQGRNLGYVPANNVGLRHARGPYSLFLNNDAFVEEGALERLVAFMDAHPRAGAVSGKILNPDRSDQGTARRFPTVANAIFGRRSWLTRLFPDNPWARRYMVGRHRTDDEPFEVETLSSAAMMVRTAEALAMGGMDEAFYLYWVDSEMCARFRRQGFGIWCVPRAIIVHYEGQGGSTKTFRRRMRSTIGFHRDSYLAYTKVHRLTPWRPPAMLVAVLLAIRCGLLVALQLLQPSRATSSGGRN